VEWPSGIVQELREVASRQFLTVVEPELTVTPRRLDVPAGTNVTFVFNTTLLGRLALQWLHNGEPLLSETNTFLNISDIHASDLGAYRLRVLDLDTGFALDSPAATLSGARVIAIQPQDQFVRLGSNAAFQVNVSGFGPIAYQWQFNGTNLAEGINSKLAITNASLANDGLYSVVVSNSYGALTSTVARLGVLIKPTITAHPLSQSVPAGGDVNFSVSAMGNPLPLSFRWRINGSTITNLTLYETNCFFTFANVQPAAMTNQVSFTVVVTNLAGSSSLSSNAVVIVLPDSDGDGLPDEWEIAHGFSTSDATDALRDSDRDKATNAQEYKAGTDPNDPRSLLRLDQVSYDETKHWRVTFVAVSNRTYSVQASERFGADSALRNVAEVTAAPTNRIVEGDSTRRSLHQPTVLPVSQSTPTVTTQASRGPVTDHKADFRFPAGATVW